MLKAALKKLKHPKVDQLLASDQNSINAPLWRGPNEVKNETNFSKSSPANALLSASSPDISELDHKTDRLELLVEKELSSADLPGSAEAKEKTDLPKSTSMPDSVTSKEGISRLGSLFEKGIFSADLSGSGDLKEETDLFNSSSEKGLFSPLLPGSGELKEEGDLAKSPAAKELFSTSSPHAGQLKGQNDFSKPFSTAELLSASWSDDTGLKDKADILGSSLIKESFFETKEVKTLVFNVNSRENQKNQKVPDLAEFTEPLEIPEAPPETDNQSEAFLEEVAKMDKTFQQLVRGDASCCNRECLQKMFYGGFNILFEASRAGIFSGSFFSMSNYDQWIGIISGYLVTPFCKAVDQLFDKNQNAYEWLRAQDTSVEPSFLKGLAKVVGKQILAPLIFVVIAVLATDDPVKDMENELTRLCHPLLGYAIYYLSATLAEKTYPSEEVDSEPLSVPLQWIQKMAEPFFINFPRTLLTAEFLRKTRLGFLVGIESQGMHAIAVFGVLYLLYYFRREYLQKLPPIRPVIMSQSVTEEVHSYVPPSDPLYSQEGNSPFMPSQESLHEAETSVRTSIQGTHEGKSSMASSKLSPHEGSLPSPSSSLGTPEVNSSTILSRLSAYRRYLPTLAKENLSLPNQPFIDLMSPENENASTQPRLQKMGQISWTCFKYIMIYASGILGNTLYTDMVGTSMDNNFWERTQRNAAVAIGISTAASIFKGTEKLWSHCSRFFKCQTAPLSENRQALLLQSQEETLSRI